jgi:hypothetical protein
MDLDRVRKVERQAVANLIAGAYSSAYSIIFELEARIQGGERGNSLGDAFRRTAALMTIIEHESVRIGAIDATWRPRFDKMQKRIATQAERARV